MKKTGRFHVLTDTVVQDRYSHIELTEMALAGGADTIQFRSKSGSTRKLIETALKMKELCSKADVPLIINDRVDVALASGADGVHLGQDDFPIPLARKLLGENAIIGGSAGNIEEAEICFKGGADYLGVGPVFATGSKSDAGPATGIERIKMIVNEFPMPVIAIGGITAAYISELIDAGAHGIAVISAVCLEENPESAARNFSNTLSRYRKG